MTGGVGSSRRLRRHDALSVMGHFHLCDCDCAIRSSLDGEKHRLGLGTQEDKRLEPRQLANKRSILSQNAFWTK
jgi:hypothetical protein